MRHELFTAVISTGLDRIWWNFFDPVLSFWSEVLQGGNVQMTVSDGCRHWCVFLLASLATNDNSSCPPHMMESQFKVHV